MACIGGLHAVSKKALPYSSRSLATSRCSFSGRSHLVPQALQWLSSIAQQPSRLNFRSLLGGFIFSNEKPSFLNQARNSGVAPVTVSWFWHQLGMIFFGGWGGVFRPLDPRDCGGYLPGQIERFILPAGRSAGWLRILTMPLSRRGSRCVVPAHPARTALYGVLVHRLAGFA